MGLHVEPHIGLQELQPFLLGWLLATARLGGCLALFPLLQKALLPGLLRSAVIAGFSLLFIPLIVTHTAPDNQQTLAMWLLLLGKEVLLGALIGVVVAMPFWIAESMGMLIDTQSGGASASMHNQSSGNESAILAGLMYQVFAAYFVTMGGVSWLVGVIADSFIVWPPHSWWPTMPAAGMDWWLQQMNQMMALIVVLAAPALIAMFLAEFALGLAGRFAPSLQVFFVAMPIKYLTALFMLPLYCGLAMTRLGQDMLYDTDILAMLGKVLR